MFQHDSVVAVRQADAHSAPRPWAPAPAVWTAVGCALRVPAATVPRAPWGLRCPAVSYCLGQLQLQGRAIPLCGEVARAV